MKDFRIELRWGILFSFVLMGWMFLEKQMGWHTTHIDGQLGKHFLVLIIMFIIVFYAGIREKRDSFYKGSITWKRAFISGAMIAVLITVLSPFVQFFIYHYISPDYFKNMIDYQMNKEKFPMKKESAEMFFTMKGYIIQAVFTDLSFGLMTSAILALFLRTDKKK